MSIDYLDDLQKAVESGREIFGCPSQTGNQWHISSRLDDLRPKAQRLAETKRYAVHIYRLVDGGESMTDSFLAVKKITPGGNRSEPIIDWMLVDTREAAEMLRDVTYGPSPFFGLLTEETLNPNRQ